MFFDNEVAIKSQAKSKTLRFPAPIRGLIRNENIVLTKKAGAAVMENWFPTTTGLKTRRGVRKHATLTGSSAVMAMMTYQATGQQKLFPANDSGIFDATAPATPSTVLSPAAGIGTSTNGDYSHVQFANASGEFLLCVNGVNLHKVYNGTAWAENSPAITGTTTDNWSHIWSFKNRIFGVKKNTQTAIYLPVDSIGGAATEFTLGGVFKRGGQLLTGGTWSLDSGEGLDDLCFFASTEGEVAVYSGSDPSSSITWQLQGVYNIGRPMGKKAFFRAGGDVVIATDDGLVPLSAAVNKDRAALQSVAASYPIEELWLQQTGSRNAVPWQCAVWPLQQKLIVSTPTYGGATAQVLVANTRTGGWTVFNGLYDCRGLAPLGQNFYFGNSSGIVYQAESGASDDGQNYVCRAAGLFEDMGSPALQKIAKLMRGIFQSSYQDFNPQFSVSTDFQTTWPAPPTSAAEPSTSGLWGSSTWGAFVWGGSTSRYRKVDWYGVDGVGASVSWQCQVTLGNTAPPDIELAGIDFVHEVGEAVA
jgi:hypothetical protein